MKSIGFITSENLETFYQPLNGHVAVYIPQTFQVAGFTFLVPKEDVEVVDIKPEDAMKFVLSGGMTSKK
ncbi:putative membrane protein [Peribacillus deserti]|uniref:Membrane protein n=1 Tax=Peribacillus deserti TaxID=673318 RepID=A0ABS2QHD0_9BACI|nr:putative membrane protein [Peribacillus deserti]